MTNVKVRPENGSKTHRELWVRLLSRHVLNMLDFITLSRVELVQCETVCHSAGLKSDSGPDSSRGSDSAEQHHVQIRFR